MKVSVEEARRLFDEDSQLSVFRGSCDAHKRWVNVYPRKTADGFVYCIWGPGVAAIGTLAIVGGGIVTGSKPLVDAAQEAVAAMFEHIEEGGLDGCRRIYADY